MSQTRQAKIWVIGMLAVILLFTSIPFVYALDQALPFRPYVLYGREGVPQDICPGAGVQVSRERLIQDGANVQRVEIKRAWTRADGASGPEALEYESSVTLVNLTVGERTEVDTPEVNVTPEEAGEWVLVTEITAYGREFLLPDTQTITTRSDNPVTVLPYSAPGCSETPPEEEG